MILKSSSNKTLRRPSNHLSSNINPTFGLKSKWDPIPENPKIPQVGATRTEDSNQDNQLTSDIHDLKLKLKQDSKETEQPPKQ